MYKGTIDVVRRGGICESDSKDAARKGFVGVTHPESPETLALHVAIDGSLMIP